MAKASSLPGVKKMHRLTHIGPSNYRCSCGTFLGVSNPTACQAIHEHRESIPFDEWLAEFIEPGDCWIWTGKLHSAGYGRAGDMGTAHNFVYTRLIGPVGDGLELDHLCRNRACCNPDHLEPVTREENTRRGYGVAALNRRKSACASGHPFTPENTYLSPAGRHCRTCRRVSARANYERKLADRATAGTP